MKKKLLFMATIFFSILNFAMEQGDDDSRIINQSDIEKAQDRFDQIPDELILNIFSILIEDAYTSGANPIEKLVNIFSNNVFARIQCVNKRFARILVDNLITNKIRKLRNHLFANNKAVLEEEFLQICSKKQHDKTNENTKPMTLVKCCLKAINNFMIKRDQFNHFKPNFNNLSFELHKEICNLYSDYKKLRCLLKANININAKDNYNKTSLELAFLIHNTVVIGEILKYMKDIDINIKLEILAASLIRAAQCNDKETVEIILNYISNFDINNKLKLLNVKHETGQTPLMRAIFLE